MENGVNNNIKINFSFYIFLFFVIYFGGFSLILSYFLALFIHEYSHMLVAKKYGVLSQSINIYAFGMSLSVNNVTQNKSNNVMIFLIGPLINILTIIIVVALWWCYPILYFYTKDFVFANFMLGFFNLIPLYPLDGGNVILHSLKSVKTKLNVLKCMKIFCVVFGLLFIFLFVWSTFYNINFSCFGIAFFLLSSALTYKDFFDKEIINKFDEPKIKESKIYVIRYDTKYEDVKKCFDKNFYVQFYLLDADNRVVKIFTQESLKEYYLKHVSRRL